MAFSGALVAFPPSSIAAPTFSGFVTANSTGATIPQTSWNNLAAGVTATMVLGNAGGLDLTGPAPLAPIPGTFGLYHFDETSGTTSPDSSGNGNSFTLTGDTFTAAMFGNGHYSQNLGYDAVTLKSAATITTVEMWFRITSDKDYADLVSFTDGSNEIDMTYLIGGYLQGASWDNSTATLETFTTVNSYADNNWHLMTFMVYPSSAALWVDGVPEGSDTSGKFVPPISVTKIYMANDFGLATAQGPPSSSLDWDETRFMTVYISTPLIQNDRNNGNPVWIQVSTNAGASYTVVTSTIPGTTPYLSVTGSNGATSSTLSVVGLSLVQSTSSNTGATATDQLFFWATPYISSSTESAAFGVLVDTSPPPAVTTLTGATSTTAEIDNLTWTTPTPADNGSSGVGAYYVQYSTNSAVTFSTSSAQVVVSTSGIASGANETLSVSGLLPGTTEFFRIWSEDNAGNFSAVSNSTSAAVRPVAPGATAPAFTAVDLSSVTAQWIDGINGSSTTYVLEASTAANFTGTLTSSATANMSATVGLGTALTANTTYYLQVEAVFAGQASTFTALGSTSTLAAVPTAVSVKSVFQSSVTLQWTAATSEGYLVLASTVSSFVSDFIYSSSTANGAVTSLTVTGLDSGTTYFFEVGSLNWNGAADFAAEVSTKTSGATSPQPGTPPFLSATTGSVTAQWLDESHPASNSFILQESTSSNFVTITGSSQTVYTSATISGLAINTTYYFQVESVVVPSTSQPAFVGSTATLAVPIGSAASTYTAVYQSSFTLQFTSGTSAGGFDPTGTTYLIEASTAAGFGIVNATSQGTSTTTALTGLLPGTTYFVQGQAINFNKVATAFTSLGSTVTAVTPPGTSPPNFPTLATTSLTVEWSSGTTLFNPVGTEYLVELATSASFSTITASSATYNLSATLSGLTADTVYFAQVQATNGLTTSAFTSLASTSTLALAPTSLSFNSVYQTSATLSWTSGGTSSGYELDLSTASNFSGTLISSITSNSALLTLTDPGLSPNTVYYARIGSLTSFQAQDYFVGGSTVTLAAAPSVTANVSTGVAQSIGTFLFTNAAGFGAGTVDHFLTAFDQASTHSYTGSEAQWNAGTLIENASQEGNWYLHLESVNSGGTPSSTLDFGAFVFSSSSPTGTNFESFNSYGSAVPQTSWNNLAAGVTSQITVQATSGLDNGGTVAPLAPVPGTFILWHLNEGTGLTAYDSSGNGNNGYLSVAESPWWTGSPTWVAGKFGNGLSFAGGEGVQSTQSPATTAQTEEFWFNMSAATALGTIFSMRDVSQDEIIVGLNSGKFYASSFNQSSGQTGTFQAANTISTGAWHHGALVMASGGGGSLYIDGAFAVSLSTFHAAYAITNVTMGSDDGYAKSYGYLTSVSVDELRVSTLSFTAAQIASDYSSGNPYYALLSTNTGSSFTAITSTSSASPPYLSITGANGATTPQTLSAFGLALLQSTSAATGSSGTNQITYYATDILGHASALGPFAVLVDSTPPTAVANLAISTASPGSATLTWSAPSNPGLSGLAKYYIEYSTNPSVVFSTSAAQVVLSTSGVVTGSTQTAVVTGLSTTANEYLALFSADAAQNFSPVSNTVEDVVVTGGPLSPAFTQVYQTSATVAWTGTGGGTGYTVNVTTDPTFATGLASSSTANVALTTLTVSGLSTDGLYYMEVVTNGSGGGTTIGGSTVTLPAASSLSANVSTGAATTYGTFSFANVAGFGFGGLDHYLVAWNNSATYSFTGSEPIWSSGTILESASSEGSWYLHVDGFNSAGNAGPQSDLDFGPMVFSSTGPVSTDFLSYNSSGTQIPQTSWNNLASGVTAQVTVEAAQGLNVTSAAASAPTQDMVAYWKFNESTGTVALDSTGNGNSGTLTGSPLPTRVAGKFGGALSFNGGAQEVVSTFVVTGVEYTMSAWFEASSGASGYFFVLKDTASHVAEIGLENGGKLTGAWASGSFASTTTYLNGAWHNATLTLLAPSTATLYADGALVAQTTSFAAAFTPAYAYMGYQYTGLLDDVFFSTKTYSSAQVQSLLVGNPFYVEYSTNTGASFVTVTSTVPSTTSPYIALASTEGATGASTFTVYNLPLHHTENFGTGSSGANQVSFFFNDVNDDFAQGGPFAVLVDTVAPGTVTNLAAQTGAVNGEIILSWPAPGDDAFTLTDSSGGYLINYSTSPISSTAAFAAAASVGTSPTPLAPGTTQTLHVEGFSPGSTYYFALETYDKAGNVSGLSNSPSATPYSAQQILINEVFPSTSASTAWIELVNETTAAVSLQGWTLVYNQGSLASPGPESTVWTGTSTLISASTGLYVITPSSAIAGSSSFSVILKASGTVIDEVQWPVLSTTESFGRTIDGGPYFEIKPTPTKGALNAISTDTTKINEVDYQSLSNQFIELYNTGSTETITGYTLRNKNGVLFTITRTIGTHAFDGVVPGSLDNNGNSYTTSFGASGLAAAGDFLVLSNAVGQTVDRVTWQSGTNYSLYNSTSATLTSDLTPAPGNAPSPDSIGRQPTDGSDTGVDSTDFAEFSATSLGLPNSSGTAVASNTLTYPTSSSTIPRRFELNFAFGQSWASGNVNTVWFNQTGGTADGHSPHIFNLSSLGVFLTTTSAQQPILVGATVQDTNGYSLVDQAVYQLLFNTTASGGRPPQISLSNVTYDGRTHTPYAFSNPPVHANVGQPSALFGFVLPSSSPATGNPIQINSFSVEFTSSNASTPLTTAQLQALFGNLSIALDAGLGPVADVYYPTYDTSTLVSISSSSFSLASGVMSVSISTSAAGTVSAAGSKTFYLVGTWAPGSATASPNSLQAIFNPGTGLGVIDAPSGVAQILGSTNTLTSSTATVVVSTGPPSGTSWPTSLGSSTNAIVNQLDFGNDCGGVTSCTFYAGTLDGKIVALNSNGTVKWSYGTGGTIHSAPYGEDVDTTTGKNVVTFGNDNGLVGKLRDDGTAGTLLWSTSLGGAVQATIVPDGTDTNYYVATTAGTVSKLVATTGAATSGWTAPSLTGAVTTSVPYDDEYTGINALWVGTQGNVLYNLNTTDGAVGASLTTGGPISGTPAVYTGFANPARDTHNLYIGSSDGKLYSRVGSNLTTVPSSWTDVNVGTPFNSSPFLNTNESPNAIYIGNDNGLLYKVNASSGGIVWTYQTGGAVRGTPLPIPASYTGFTNSWVYFGSLDGYFYAVNWTSGALAPGFPVYTGGPITSAPVYDSNTNTVSFGGGDGKVYRVGVAQ